MAIFSFLVTCSFLVIFNLQLHDALPVSSSLTSAHLDSFKVLLGGLEEALAERRDHLNMDARARQPEDAAVDEASIREFLSTKNLKSVHNNNNSKKSSACFGRRMDRIGSMSSLGCNNVGK
ncbi:brain natriuretic peptide-like [Entelurus aequoreus]|uniref:brain natriuretic peptide-like n=1 Tax=Entelurus aequoreus TaxID=161455 RepID=UPI002B1D95F5|nr:brain natriuretic peptide-like [Entelurus aequoreus]